MTCTYSVQFNQHLLSTGYVSDTVLGAGGKGKQTDHFTTVLQMLQTTVCPEISGVQGSPISGSKKGPCEGRHLKRVEVEYMCQINFAIHFI